MRKRKQHTHHHVDMFRASKVDHFDFQSVCVLHHDILWFQIAMDNFVLLKKAQSNHQFVSDLFDLVEIHAVQMIVIDIFVQCHLQEFRDQTLPTRAAETSVDPNYKNQSKIRNFSFKTGNCIY